MICSICSHPQRTKIDSALLNLVPLRHTAAEFATSTASLRRHKANCLPAHLLKAKELSDELFDGQSASALVKELRELARKTGLILTRAISEKNGDLALKAIARLERQLELKARLLGELEERGATAQRIEVHYIDKAVILPGASGQLAATPARARLPAPE
jgi:hypothetical protein